MRHVQRKQQAVQDIIAIIVSIMIAILIIRSGSVHAVLSSFGDLQYLGSFFAGICFTSIFTIAPAAAVLAELAQNNSIWLVALWGGIGAVIGDYILFTLVRDRFTEDLKFLLGASSFKRLFAVRKTKMFPWLVPLTGAIIIASPLPDEIGLTLLGLSKMKEGTFIALTFVMNAIGILIVGWVGQAMMW
jgi:hypothetical protein